MCLCGQRVSGVELDFVLKEVKARLEKAVELMEEDRPGVCVGVLVVWVQWFAFTFTFSHRSYPVRLTVRRGTLSPRKIG